MSFGYPCRVHYIVAEVRKDNIVGVDVVGKDTGVMVCWVRGCVWCFICRQE